MYRAGLLSRWGGCKPSRERAWISAPAAGVHQLSDETRDRVDMVNIDGTNTSSTSTKWEWRHVKVERAAIPPKQSAVGRRSRPKLRPWPRRKPLGVKLYYRGGTELDWGIIARGRRWHFDGFVALEDVMATVMGHEQYRARRGTVVEVSSERMFDMCTHD